MKKFFNSLLCGNSPFSSKRFITLAAFGLMALAFLCNLFFGLIVIESMYDTMSYIVMAGLGFTASELFAPKKAAKFEAIEPVVEPEAEVAPDSEPEPPLR